jgi:hypothetical protein
VASPSLVAVFEGFVLRLREENVTGSDQVQLVEAGDSEEETGGAFDPRACFRHT